MNSEDKSKDEVVNGAASVVKILNEYPNESRERILQAIQASSPQAFAKIKSNIITFDDIPYIVSEGLQILVREMSHSDLVLAVAHGSIKVKEALLKSMSERKARSVLEETTYALRSEPNEVANMRKRFVEKIDELRKSGTIRTESPDDVWV